MSRAKGWGFFVTTFGKLADAVSSSVQAATKAAPQALTAHEAAKLDVLLAKATRAKQMLQQLQEFEVRHRRLQQQYQPVVARLPQLQQELAPDQLLAAAEFAASQGMQEPLSQQVTGKCPQSSITVTDPFGIRIALRKGHPLSLLSWQEYLSIINRVAAASEQFLPGQALQQLVAFQREQRQLVMELEALRSQLKEEVPIPLLQPLHEECERLDQLVQGLTQVQAAHVSMLRRDLEQLDLGLLELRLQLHLGPSFSSSPEAAALQRLRRLHAVVSSSRRTKARADLEHTDSSEAAGAGPGWAAPQQQQAAALAASVTLQQDLEALGRLMQRWRQQQQQETQDMVELNIQRFQRELFQRLSQLQGAQEQQQQQQQQVGRAG